MEKGISPTKAIMTFFNTEGYEPLKARELLDFKNSDKEGYEELGELAIRALRS